MRMLGRHASTYEILKIIIGGDINQSTTSTGGAKKKKKPKAENRIKTTKYTLLSFLPMNLLEQFRRVANFYFLVMTIIVLAIDSPVSPVTTVLPLLFVVTVTAAKQGYEDYLRHKVDNVVNNSPVTIIRDGNEVNVKCMNITPGDLVQLTKDCDVPCDMVLLKTSEQYNRCYVTTANLDGETNLKTLKVPARFPTDVSLSNLHNIGLIECEKPRTDLYTFNGKILLRRSNSNLMNQSIIDLSTVTESSSTINGSPLSFTQSEQNLIPLTAENLLLRGSRIKNTVWVIGCAIYTGEMTKLALNSKITKSKIPSSEEYINRFLIFVLVVLLFLVNFSYFMKKSYEVDITLHKYIGPPQSSVPFYEFLQDFLSFLVIYNYLIPISLYVTIEISKFIGAFFLEWDKYLYDETTDQPCIVNTSNINEELGQINILFSDKTGTLTKNEMLLQQVSVKGNKFQISGYRLQRPGSVLKFDIKKFNDDQLEFFKALALCHTVKFTRPEEYESSTQIQTDNQLNTKLFSDIEEEDDLNVHNDGEERLMERVDYVQLENRKDNHEGEVTKKLNNNNAAKERLENSRPPSNRTRESSQTLTPTPGGEDRPFTYPNLQQMRNTPEFNRSTSHVDLQTTTMGENGIGHINIHRRTQSYGAPSSITTRTLQRINPSQILLSNSFLSTRQGYAMPSFTRESLISRRESLRRNQQVKGYLEKFDYQASSPDEKALVEACAQLGIVFMGDDNEILHLNIFPKHFINDTSQKNNVVFKRLRVLEFTSDRKCMSVIVQNEQNEIWLYTKGAENIIFPLCRREDRSLIQTTDRHIRDFSTSGFRTLAVARKKLTKEEYKAFNRDILNASTSLHNRKFLIQQCYETIERDLELLGATAVEDALQDNIRDTLLSLQEAGIRIWVLTGDKIETAFNIALSCGHISETSRRYFITECRNAESIRQHLGQLKNDLIGHGLNDDTDYALLIDGRSLEIALKYESERFRDLSTRCKAVLCCRLSPLQKAKVVQLIKDSKKPHFITAAIGDGANDVAMLQVAHVGLGILGKEGRQAASTADYAFSNFSMIKRVLLVHGHYYSKRLSLLVLYFFYKNIVFIGVQFLFQFYAAFSSISLFDSLFLTFYNMLYTSMPILLLSLTEKPYSDETLMQKPQLYKTNINNKHLQWTSFIGWCFAGVYTSLLCFYGTYALFIRNDNLLAGAITLDFTCFGTYVMFIVVVIVNVKLIVEAKYQTHIFLAGVILSIASFMVSTIVYNLFVTSYDTEMYWSYFQLLTSLPLWLLTILLVIMDFLPCFIQKTWKYVLKMPSIKIFPGERQRRQHNLNEGNNFNNTESTNI